MAGSVRRLKVANWFSWNFIDGSVVVLGPIT